MPTRKGNKLVKVAILKISDKFLTFGQQWVACCFTIILRSGQRLT